MSKKKKEIWRWWRAELHPVVSQVLVRGCFEHETSLARAAAGSSWPASTRGRLQLQTGVKKGPSGSGPAFFSGASDREVKPSVSYYVLPKADCDTPRIKLKVIAGHQNRSTDSSNRPKTDCSLKTLNIRWVWAFREGWKCTTANERMHLVVKPNS